MEKLNTIQKREKLNTVIARGDKGNGNAYHDYQVIFGDIETGKDGVVLTFQNGARNIPESIHGIIDTDLLEIVRHRLQCFQEGDFRTRENAVALTHIEEALMWMNRRIEDRIERNVLGTNNK